jgi:glycine oxidase
MWCSGRVGTQCRAPGRLQKAGDPGAIRRFPGLAATPVVQTWAGFRPHTRMSFQSSGPAPVLGLFLASGHLRHGILLTPFTANVLTDTILGRTPSIDLTPFRVDRKALTL